MSAEEPDSLQPSPWTRAAFRVLSGVSGAFILLAAGLFSFGAALAAPLGILVARRIARRKGRRLTRGASWLGAAVASSIAMAALFIALVTLLPDGTFQEMQEAAASAQAEDTTRSSDWFSRTFPTVAPPDTATLRLLESPEFIAIGVGIGFALGSVMFGAIAGSAGWLGTTLLGYAFQGRRADAAAP